MRLLLAAIVGYCVGSISSAVLVGKAVGGIDVRKYGSGSAGGANVGRVLGVRYGVLVACCDVAKGMAAAVVGQAIDHAGAALAAMFDGTAVHPEEFNLKTKRAPCGALWRQIGRQ